MQTYAVIETGGKQYRVQAGEIVQVEKLEGEVGTSAQFKSVLLMATLSDDATKITLGKPLLAGALVDGEIVGQGRGEKLLLIKMKRRKQYRRTQGHRQNYTQVLITGISHGSEKITLSDDDKKTTMSKFQSHLKPKGLAFTPKTLGSRKKLAAKAAAAHAAGGTKATATKKTTATKTAAKKATT